MRGEQVQTKRPDQMPTLDEVRFEYFGPEDTRHEGAPRAGDELDVRISIERPDGLVVWDERVVVTYLTEYFEGEGTTKIVVAAERREDAPS